MGQQYRGYGGDRWGGSDWGNGLLVMVVVHGSVMVMAQAGAKAVALVLVMLKVIST